MRNTGGVLPIGHLGALVLDGSGNHVLFQSSYNDYTFAAGEYLAWRDHFNAPGAGQYTAQLIICYSTQGHCEMPDGEWEVLIGPIPFTVQ